MSPNAIFKSAEVDTFGVSRRPYLVRDWRTPPMNRIDRHSHFRECTDERVLANRTSRRGGGHVSQQSRGIRLVGADPEHALAVSLRRVGLRRLIHDP
jgi:hypothetical protein